MIIYFLQRDFQHPVAIKALVLLLLLYKLLAKHRPQQEYLQCNLNLDAAKQFEEKKTIAQLRSFCCLFSVLGFMEDGEQK